MRQQLIYDRLCLLIYSSYWEDLTWTTKMGMPTWMVFIWSQTILITHISLSNYNRCWESKTILIKWKNYLSYVKLSNLLLYHREALTLRVKWGTNKLPFLMLVIFHWGLHFLGKEKRLSEVLELLQLHTSHQDLRWW